MAKEKMIVIFSMDELTQIETVGTTDGTRESIVILSTSYF
jgi:hypothetical protein